MKKELQTMFHAYFRMTLVLALAGWVGSESQAEIVVSLDNLGSTNVDLGTPGLGKSIDFYISESGTDRLLAAAIPQFTLSAGTITNPAGVISTTGAGTPGYFGEGNLDVSTIEIVPGTMSRSFIINQAFKDIAGVQEIPNDPIRSLWFTLNLDTTGLSEGSYGILFSDPDNSFFDEVGIPISTNNNLTFSITAVPEPSGFTAVAVAAAGMMLIRRRDRRRQRSSGF